MNPGYNEVNYQTILNNAKMLNIPITVFRTEIFDTVVDITDSPCYLCARMRRGYLYSKARELGCNKIALGHHFDDVIETIVMGMLYGAQIQTMMPKLHSTNFEGMELIRPLYLVREADIIHWAQYNDLHFIQCACKFTDTCTTCNNEENRSKRVEIKELIKNLKKVNPFVESNIFRSVENVNIDTVVGYKQHGILNGINMDAFNPETDSKIFKNYGPNNPQDKLVNKTELLKLCGLEGDANTPVIGIVTRFVDQKGLYAQKNRRNAGAGENADPAERAPSGTRLLDDAGGAEDFQSPGHLQPV